MFARNEFDLGEFTDITHGVDTGNARPIKLRMRRTPACFVQEEEAHLKKMLEAGVIQESTSDWAAAPVLIRKRDGSVRWCIDYRALNNVTIKDVFPLPLVDDCLDTLAGNPWFSKLDANSAYWQIKLNEEDRYKTAFVTKYGLFEHVKMGFGLCNAPATYARAMNLVLRGLCWKTVLAFLDDILVLGKTFNDHLDNLVEVLRRFRQYKLKLKPKKCMFFRHEVEFLGRVVNGESLSMSKADIQVVLDWPIPTCSKDVQKFLGLANYHRAFVKEFADIAEPLFRVVGKNGFRWEQEQQDAFEELQTALTNPPVLALPNQQDEFILDTDASNLAVGAELIQIQDGEEKVVAYGSYALTPEQRRYCVTRKELLAVVRFCRQYRYYILGRPFVLRTDHASLTWLLNFREPQGQLARWMEELSQYNMVLKHRPGRKHTNADALSRIITNEVPCGAFSAGITPDDLPCGGCKYCTKAYENWGSFMKDVDEAIPLVSTIDMCTLSVPRTESPEGSIGLQGTTFGPKKESTIAVGGEIKDGAQEGSPEGNTVQKVPGRFAVQSLSSGARPESQPRTGQWESCMLTGVDLSTNLDYSTHVEGTSIGWEDLSQSQRQEGALSQCAEDTPLGRPGGTQPMCRKTTQCERCGDICLNDLDSPLVMPWDEGGCSMDGEAVAHVDCVITGEGLDILSCGIDPHINAVDTLDEDVPSCWGISLKELREEQLKDGNLTSLILWLSESKEPAKNELFSASPAVKFYWLNKETCKLVDGVCYITPKDSTDRLLILPDQLKEKVLELNHDIPLAGHQGIARTLKKVKEKFFWYGVSDYVRHYVTTCATCSKNKKTDRYGRFPMTAFQAGAPMERVHIDFLGPLPKTARGNEHILMMVDQFTKWVECVPLPSQTADVTARAAVNELFSRFGMPFQVHSDQGRNFESKLFAAVCKALHIHKTRTTPYRPSANGQVERYNRTLMDAVRCFVGKSQHQWDIELAQIAGALRASVNRSTGFTANKLMLGREVNMPAHLMFPSDRKRDDPQTADPESYAATLVHNLNRAHETARTTLKTTLRRMKRNYDLRVLEKPYEEGDVIHLLDTAVIKGKCKKLSPPWKGPGVITKKISACIYRIKLKNSVFVTNHDRLKPCRDRVLPGWIKRWKDGDRDDEIIDTNDKLYCSCRKPWEGRFMILCDYCQEWFHGSCVNVTSSEALNIDKYKCPGCAQ